MLPYITSPRWAKVLQKYLYAARYVFLMAAGVVAVTTFTGFTMTLVGWTLIVGGAMAIIGVVTGRFHIELIPIWFILAALLAAGGVLIDLDRATSALLVWALLPALSERLLHLILVAQKMRKLPGKYETDGR